MSDLSLYVVSWNNLTDCEKVSKNVEAHKPDCVCIVGIPRHHAKKVLQQRWTKRYFVSKERKEVSLTRPDPRGVRITLILSVHPFSSEEWISPKIPAEGVIEPSETVEEDTKSDIAHCAEICIPLGGWKTLNSPIELLQEYQLAYDQVSTITFVAVADESKCPIKPLQEVFNAEKLENSVVFISRNPEEIAPTISMQLKWWKQSNSEFPQLLNLVSDPIES